MRTTLFTFLCASLCFALPADAKTIKVPGNQPTIAAAEAAAADGDTIQLGKGRWQEAIVTTKSLKFVGGKGVIWDGYFSGSHKDQLVATANGVVVKDIEFQNGDDAVSITGDDARIQNCKFKGCSDAVFVDGARARVLENRFFGLTSSPGIWILGPDSKVSDNELRDSDGAGIEIDAESLGSATVMSNVLDTCQDDMSIVVRNASAPKILKNTIQYGYQSGPCIEADTCDDAEIAGNRLLCVNYYAEGIEVSGDRAMVYKNVLDTLNCYSDDQACISVTGNEAVIKKNKIRNCGAGEDYDTWGIDVSGNDAVIESNGIYQLGGGGDETWGMEVSGDDCRIAKNKIDRLNDEYTYAIEVSGARAHVDRNDISHVMYDAVLDVSGDDFRITDNRIRFGAYDAYINISGNATAPGKAVVEGNEVSNLAYYAFYCSGNGVEYRNNSLKHIAGEGFQINGNDNLLSGNETRDTADDGYYVNGNNNMLKSCVARNSARDGFDIASGTGNTLNKCEAYDCAAEGLDNGGTNTTATKCNFKKSRIDYAGNGNMASDAGTKFTTGGAGTAQEID